jgi:DNA-binding Lrp family transcriptional regulator
MNLDVKDRRLLAELDLNARASFQELGKKTNLSKETAIYRVKRLEKRRIILRYTTLVNFAKLGYTGFAVYNRFAKADEKLKREIIEYLSNIPELYWIALTGGKYDIVFAFMCKSVAQFNNIYYRVLNKYGKNLVDNTIAIRTELRQNKRNYLVKSKQTEFIAPYFGKEPELEKIDNLDSSILSLLSVKARTTNLELSEKLKKPASTITNRIKGMKKRGIIQGYSTYIKAQNYGMQSYRLLLSLENMDEQSRIALFEYVYNNPCMILAIETVGNWNFEITLEVESHEELQKEISTLRNNFNKIIKGVDFIVMFEDDLVYDPYPLKKQERKG